MQAQCFDKHCAGQLLCDQGAAWLRVTHFAKQPVDCPAKRLPLRLAFQQDYGRQRIQEKTRVAFQPEVTAKDEKVISWSQCRMPL